MTDKHNNAPAQEVGQGDHVSIGRVMAEQWLSAMEGVIDVADRKTDEFDALRKSIIDLTLLLHAGPAPTQNGELTDRQFDLICQAIDKADTVTMDGDYMLDSDDCIRVVRVMQVLFDIAALRAKGGGK